MAREPQRRTAQGLESRAGVDPSQRIRGRLASRRFAAKGQTDQDGTTFSDLAIFGLAFTAIMAVGHIGGAAAHRRSVAPQTNFIDVFWRVVSDRPGCFPAWR